MPRSDHRQGRSAPACDHRNTPTLSECLKLLRTLSTAQSTDAFRQLDGVTEFVDLCAEEPCSHFKRSFLEDLWPAVCQASASALQLLHGSSESFEQQSEEVLQGTRMLLKSLKHCMLMVQPEAEPSQATHSKARLERLLTCVTAAGRTKRLLQAAQHCMQQ